MLNQSCQTLSGIGAVIAKKLARCGINTIQDLLFHLPYRYQDRTRITPIRDLRANHWAVIVGQVCKVELKQGRRPSLLCYVEDQSGFLVLRFFHFNKHQLARFKTLPLLRAFGEVRPFSAPFEMVHPEYQCFDTIQAIPEVEETLTPIYSSTQGLSQTRLRQLIKQALQHAQDHLTQLEWMDLDLLQKHHFFSLPNAIDYLHNPPPDSNLSRLESGKHPALMRLILDELIAHRVSMHFARKKRATYRAPILPIATTLTQRFLSQLPFSLTKAQDRVWHEIEQDLCQKKPMLRLVQGDVGSGKTVIAALAAIQAVAQQYQVAFMAPTDILSDQHANTLEPWLHSLGLRLCRLSGKMTSKAKKEALQHIAQHETDVIVGTHALFQDGVNFARLGLIIIDEQHRFGVTQRMQLHQKGITQEMMPHQLLLTATPIPRTLAMTQFAHLDLSIIDELPPGRTPITTAILHQSKRDEIINRLRNALSEGKQAYWVCTLIEESEKLQCIAASATAKQLQEQLPHVRIGLIHGKLKNDEKDAMMKAFKAGAIHLLVATTVIEVGVDVPNASLMIIENAERLGLSQLHQLRGRVGRGSTHSFCLLLYQTPISALAGERLQVMRQTNDGFTIAEKDLQLRGSGEFLGTRQTGYRHFKITDLNRDQALLPLAESLAKTLMTQDSHFAHQLATRWLGAFETFLHG